MSQTITVAIFYVDTLKEFLETQGMTFDAGLEGEVFLVELRDKPEVLVKLEAAGFFSDHKRATWNLAHMTSTGMTLYLLHPVVGDGYVFVPFNNIVAIHTVTDEWAADVRENSVMKRPVLHE
ncbi:hypothetical protein [Paraburkholderia caribensis]|uniref:hypothetical protein n=1 Tax=Paraburkholderia caribensis TaxID=75105 RepID=UPI00078D2FF2|nr:hypothetical protein [Paraburkholderia caribensis]AMV47835.1 hypothetical protein ATN79_45030 [Paraburkholderia caribensis]